MGFIAAVVALVFGYFQKQAPQKSVEQVYEEKNAYRINKVYDGDTFELEGGARVRLIGIDTPESYPNEKAARDSMRTGIDVGTIVKTGKQAKEFVEKLIEGKEVRLEFDFEKQDKYKRLLAYAYLLDGTFINAKIVQEGYANLMTIPPNVKYADLFQKLYQEARENKRGLWSSNNIPK